MTDRRFPPPWTAEQKRESFIVKDATGLPICYLYYEDLDERRWHTNRLTSDEARRIANGIARLPLLLRSGST
ncbi:MAG: hypothetical protein RIC14_01185 [Filomicrobium sp.]